MKVQKKVELVGCYLKLHKNVAGYSSVGYLYLIRVAEHFPEKSSWFRNKH